jgi:hypothetical protein
MSTDATPLEQTFQASLGRLMSYSDLDARTVPLRKVQVLVRRLTRDLGSDLSTAQHALVVRAATLMALCEHSEVLLLTGQEVPLNDYLGAANTLKRLLSTLGIRRVPREVGPSFSTLLQQDFEQQRGQEQEP